MDSEIKKPTSSLPYMSQAMVGRLEMLKLFRLYSLKIATVYHNEMPSLSIFCFHSLNSLPPPLLLICEIRTWHNDVFSGQRYDTVHTWVLYPRALTLRAGI
jgi:hypothetical protein